MPLDPGFNRILDESNLASDDNVDFEAVIEEESPITCPFIDFEAAESEDGSEITDSEEEEDTTALKGTTHIKKQNFSASFLRL